MSHQTREKFQCGKCSWRFDSPMTNCPNLSCNNEQFGDFVCQNCGTEQSGFMFMSSWRCWKCQSSMSTPVISLSDGSPYRGPKPYPKNEPDQGIQTRRSTANTRQNNGGNGTNRTNGNGGGTGCILVMAVIVIPALLLLMVTTI